MDHHPGDPKPAAGDFEACSGAQIQALFHVNADNTLEPPQLDRLNKQFGQVGLVTMTMAGNDVGFGPIIRECLRRVQGWTKWLAPLAPLAPLQVLGSGSCQSPDVQHQLDVNLNWLDGTRADNHNPENLEQVYKALRRDAPHARILILGYPHEFKPGYSHDCQHIDQADLGWANSQLTDRLDNVIQANINAANVNIEYVPTVTYFQDYPQCGGPNASAFNGVSIALGSDYQGFFHPNAQGQALLAQAVLHQLRSPALTTKTSPSPSASAASTSSCSSQTFLAVVRDNGYGQSITPSGRPTCADGYALEIFVPYAGGQEAQFFFKKNPGGTWTIIEGGNAVPTVACQTIPPKVLTQLGAGCSQAAMSPSPGSGPTTSQAGECSSPVFLSLMQSQGATVTSASGPPKCLNGYAEQNFNYPKGPAANYPTFFFHSNGHGGWTVLGGGAIGDAMSICSALPPSVRALFQLPTINDSGCPAG